MMIFEKNDTSEKIGLKPRHELRVGLAKAKGKLGAAQQVSAESGGPIPPTIGASPDKATQNIKLLDLIVNINSRNST